MFGIHNFTKTAFTFVAKVGNFSVDFTVGFIEEITFNSTANAVELLEQGTVIPKNRVLAKTSTVVVCSKVLADQTFKIISAATPNLLI